VAKPSKKRKSDSSDDPDGVVLEGRALLDYYEEERDEFAGGFRRSRKGNFWRQWGNLTVTVFKRADGYYAWSIADGDGVHYSRSGHEEEGDALESLASALGIGEI